jgi:catechol 2,3-dioxygenase-like lactoylglutathione lyase family enzyme
MERITGIGGIFFRSSDPKALHRWYAKHLGLPEGDFGAVIEWGGDKGSGSTIWSPFPADTDYFGPSGQASMVNYRVSDLDAMLAQLRDGSVEVVGDIQEMEGIGRFGWGVDPEGNRFELWEPAEGS